MAERDESGIFSGRDFRDAVGAFATGINVITTRSEENGYGLTANAFSSVSLDPPLVLICVGSTFRAAKSSRRSVPSRSTC